MLEKTYTPANFEAKIYQQWQDAGIFRAGTTAKPDAQPYCIVIPPPNVTGSLHLGHALNKTLQDILIRFERMRGKNVLWQPGTDHAGIATQMLVERRMTEQGEPDRQTIGREAFIARVWRWKEHYGNEIVAQLHRLGASCDWTRERFTMDDDLSQVVIAVFVRLYHQGLIYKDKRLVNWDPKLLTAISDLEVEPRDSEGQLWYFNYPLVNYPDRFITIATTRPETMLGDTALAVNPDDERYREMIGEFVRLPIVGREIPIIADPYPDPMSGSGALKVTPAHDFNDFEIGKRHNLPMIVIMDDHGRICLRDNHDFLAGLAVGDDLNKIIDQLDGLDRYDARTKIVAIMNDLGLITKIETQHHTLPYSARSEVVIEPLLTNQWYVDAKTMAQPAIKAVRDGKIRFIPENWQKTYFVWMENIQPWCISRQLWWGHRIPAWYGPDGQIFVAHTYDEAKEQARAHYGIECEINQDEDVLDTWFSSALWPFSALGWPQQTNELKLYYPTQVLVTGFDIIFFWVARMIMMGLHFTGKIPFHDVYLNALVRDEHGQKMSKTKGNVIDPLKIIDNYGADALRFTLSSLAATGRDIRIDEARIAGYRNFATKLWNAVRFAEINNCNYDQYFIPSNLKLPLNQWVVQKTIATATAITSRLENYRFNEASAAIYSFIWHSFCDWYIEFSKPLLSGSNPEDIKETRLTCAWVIDVILRLLHPFMPFISEEIWQTQNKKGLLAASDWPGNLALDQQADTNTTTIDWLISLITTIRSLRAQMKVAPGQKIILMVVKPDAQLKTRLSSHRLYLEKLARVGQITTVNDVPHLAVRFIVDGQSYAFSTTQTVDVKAELDRLNREHNKLIHDITISEQRLNDQQFVQKAPKKVIEQQQQRLNTAQKLVTKIKGELVKLAKIAKG